MKIKVGDKVKVIAGKEKGNEGKVIKTLKKEQKVIIEKLNIIKKHIKSDGQNNAGGILEVEAPIHVSNVKLVSEIKKEAKAKKPAKKTEKTVKKESKE